MGPDVVLVSSAEETARRVFARLVEERALAHAAEVDHAFIATGDGEEFSRLAARFLGPRLSEVEIEVLGPPRASAARGEQGT
jgi:glutamate racemase